MSFPIYILDHGEIVIPEKQEDIPHAEFWKTKVAAIIAKKYQIPVWSLLNLPYCQKRARVVGDIIYHGDEIKRSTLVKIRKAINNKNAKLIHDDHEKTLEYDVAKFKGLIS